jgi:hypothetical protein
VKQEYSRVWIFAKLSDANERNDLQVVTEIYNKLQKGIFTAASQQVADFQKLLNEVVRLRERVKELSICISPCLTPAKITPDIPVC